MGSMGGNTPDQHDAFPATAADAERTNVVEALEGDRDDPWAPMARPPPTMTPQNEGETSSSGMPSSFTLVMLAGAALVLFLVCKAGSRHDGRRGGAEDRWPALNEEAL